jgi:hypothetical protein
MKRTPEEEQRYVEEFRASLEEGERLVKGKGKRMSPILMDARGIDGHLVLLDKGIRIKRSDPAFLEKGVRGDKELAFSQIASIQIKKAGTFGSGSVQLYPHEGSGANGRGIIGQDEYRILFKASQQQAFEDIKQAIEEKLAAARVAPPPSPEPSAARHNMNSTPYIDELEKLASLKDRGILTEEEFAAKKRQILGI